MPRRFNYGGPQGGGIFSIIKLIITLAVVGAICYGIYYGYKYFNKEKQISTIKYLATGKGDNNMGT